MGSAWDIALLKMIVNSQLYLVCSVFQIGRVHVISTVILKSANMHYSPSDDQY